MKKIINIILPVLVVVSMSRCDTAGGIDSDIFSNSTSGALANWVSEPSGNILLSDPTSAVSFEVEFIDGSGGSSVDAFTMTVTDEDENTGTIISQNTFSTNGDGNQGFSGSITLNSIVAALGTAVGDYSEEDEFTFSSTITVGGQVLSTGAASQVLESVREFDLELPVETVEISAFSSKNSVLNSAATEVITIEFENDLGVSLEVLPTVTFTEAVGGAGTVSAVTRVLDEDGADSAFQVSYTPTAQAADTVSINVSGASALATGFVMTAESFDDFFIIDNVTPTTVGDNSGNVTDAGGTVLGYRFNYLFSEDIGTVTITEDYTGVDDDEDEDIDGADADGDAVDVDGVTFTANSLDFTYDWVAADGEVTLTIEITDAAGNTLNLGTVVLN